MNDISIESFAAFLDGNLSEAEMQRVADYIDANNDYSDILKDVMTVDQRTDYYTNHPELLTNEMPGMDIELPEILSTVETETVDLEYAFEDDCCIMECNEDVIPLERVSKICCCSIKNPDDIDLKDIIEKENNDLNQDNTDENLDDMSADDFLI
ncbi:MAG: hypothetical protein ACI4TR_04745 [Bacteroidaceae bacterium]